MVENNNEVLLKVENLCQYFKMGKKSLKAVDDVSFEIKKGEVFGLVGESGCGKTTTGRSIIGLYNITSGNVWFKGHRVSAGVGSYKDAIKQAKDDYEKAKQAIIAEFGKDNQEKIQEALLVEQQKRDAIIAENKENIRKAKTEPKQTQKKYVEEKVKEVEDKYAPLFAQATTEEEKAEVQKQYKHDLKVAKNSRLITQIQMIFQDPIASLNPRMTVREIVSEGLVIQGVKDKKYLEEKVYEILGLVGLVPEHAGRYPHEFSGGQRQRIGIARSVIMNPEMIIADEPISALDVSIQAQVINLLNELRERLGLTILFIAHDLSVVKYFSDRIGVMYFGKMVELATSEELFKRPLHPYTRSLLSAIPLPDPDYEKQRKRFTYDPLAEHDYSKEAPTLREVFPGHFVLCNQEEFEKYQAQAN